MTGLLTYQFRKDMTHKEFAEFMGNNCIKNRSAYFLSDSTCIVVCGYERYAWYYTIGSTGVKIHDILDTPQ